MGKSRYKSDLAKISGGFLSPDQMADKWAARLVKAERDAIRDGLTGLFNQAYIGASLARELKVAKKHGWKVGILFIDLDFLKNINDEFGHLVGDKVLKAVAEIIKDEEGETGLAGRFGGEELILIIPEAKDEEAAETDSQENGRKNLVRSSRPGRTYRQKNYGKCGSNFSQTG